MDLFKRIICLSLSTVIAFTSLNAQRLMETGGGKMPDEWIDQDTHHKVIRLNYGHGNRRPRMVRT